MKKTINRLSDPKCKKTMCPSDKAQLKLLDGLGLYLVIKKSQTRSWSFFYKSKMHPKGKYVAFGSLQVCSLKEAREKRSLARRLLREGTDPYLYFEKEKKKKILDSVNYDKYRFQYIKEETFKFMQDKSNVNKPWSKHHVKRQEAIWDNYIVPQGYATSSIIDITEDVVVEMLQYILQNRMELESGKNDLEKYSGRGTMAKAKSLISQIFDHAKHIMRIKQPDGKPIDNPVNQLKGNPLLKGLYEHKQMKSIDIDQIGEYWHKIRKLTNLQDRVFMMTSVSTALRVGSQCYLTWEMFDKFKKVFNIPAKFMKNGIAFSTPIPDDIVKLLSQIKEFRKLGNNEFKETDYIFTGRFKDSKYNTNRPRKIIREQLKYDATAHGHRTLFKDINETQNNASNISIEFQLAHSDGANSKVENAYVKSSNYWKTRTKLVSDYYNHLEKEANRYEALIKYSKKGKVATPV